MAENEKASKVSVPTIILPPRSSPETIFSGAGASPGPMTLVSNFFSEVYPDSDCRSFSQLLAGAMASPVAAAAARPSFFMELGEGDLKESGDGSEANLGFKQSRPVSLVLARSPMFTVPPGLSPSGFLNSPGFFSPGQSPFGMSHQQALAQVTAQAVLSQSHMQLQAEYQSSSLPPHAETLTRQPSFTPDETIPPLISEPKTSTLEISDVYHSDRKSQPPAHVDKPVDDGYNWRKYGQKQVKGSEYPRSYYKCTHLNCPVKKKVERSLEGQITEITYKGQHNHELPQPGKRAKDSSDPNGNTNTQAKSEVSSQGQARNLSRLNNESETAQESKQAVILQSPELNGSEEVGDTELRAGEVDDDEPNPKRRNTGAVASESASSSHKTVTEPRIIVQTRSEVDLLDDGYRWRKYGQKVVKGNPHPRSYYKCTSVGCNVRKHVERASTDPKAVITTYEGKHNHDLPAARNSTYNNNNALQPKPQKVGSEKKASRKEMEFETKDQRPVALVHLKEEQITV